MREKVNRASASELLAQYPALRGPIEGIIVNEPFFARGAWFELSGEGVATETPIIIDGRTVAKLGDGTTRLRSDGNQLYLTVVLNGRLRGVKNAAAAVEAGDVEFSADWYGAPDEYVQRPGGYRVGLLREWGLSSIRLESPEHGRGSCRRVLSIPG